MIAYNSNEFCDGREEASIALPSPGLLSVLHLDISGRDSFGLAYLKIRNATFPASRIVHRAVTNFAPAQKANVP